VTRALLLALSRSRLAAHIATNMPGVRSFSRRFVAGTTRSDALAAVARLNAAGFGATVSYLGEAVTTAAEVQAAIEELQSFVREAAARGLQVYVSVKLTELGLAFDERLARASLALVLRAADECGTFVRVDMEESRYTQVTLDIVREARRTHVNVGVVVQAYLYRSRDDIPALAREGVPVRLVKGAYREPASVAMQSKSEVNMNFARLADLYLRERAEGAWLAVATHDDRMVRAAIASATRYATPAEAIEFQMLYGIRQDLQRQLRDDGRRVRVYVPYGTHWYPYLMRRLAERPANLWFFVRAALRR
jgi:proline dehydrogenase